MPAPIFWYNLSIAEVYAQLDTSVIGLQQRDIEKRRAVYGYNVLPEPPRITLVALFFRQWKNILIYILCAAAVLAGGLGEWVDFTVIMVAILFNVLLGFVQEYKAEKSLAALRSFVTYQAKVYRDGLLRTIDARELVPGDMVLLEAGDQVPADIRLITVVSLAAAEAVLTGEAEAVTKQVEPMSHQKTVPRLVADRMNMVFKGTVIVEGKGTGIVVATGVETEVGSIADMLVKADARQTPLQESITHFSRVLVVVVALLMVLIVGIGIIRGIAFWDIVLMAMAAAVASVPEGLAVAVTVILAIGMQRILKKKALVRKLLAAETLGSTTVVCVDKTGTITQGEMHVQAIATVHEYLELSSLSDLAPHWLAFMRNTILCTNAIEERGHQGVRRVIGSPTEKALVNATIPFNGVLATDTVERLVEIPFTSRAKVMYTLNSELSRLWWCVKGAPEMVLHQCTSYESSGKILPLTPAALRAWTQLIERETAAGYRVLAMGTKEVPNADTAAYQSRGFILQGVWILVDPLRPDIKDVVQLAKNAGIRTIMITGDHVATARSIAEKIGLSIAQDSVLTGTELLTMPPALLQEKVRTVSVCARVSPEDKLQIVAALQANGEVVAMTGDGVNDAPALKTADIGIAVGSGTDVTKETADMVLLDNNFQTIIAAIEQGRIMYANIKKVLVYLMADSFNAIVLLLGSLIMGLPLPVTAVQILWVNFISDGLPAAALTIEKAEGDVMRHGPRGYTKQLLDREAMVLIFIIGVFSASLLLGVYVVMQYSHIPAIYQQSVLFVGLGLNSLVYVFSCRSLSQPLWRQSVLDNPYVFWAVLGGLVLQITPLYIPWLAHALRVMPLDGLGWLVVMTLALIQLVLIEATKYFYNRTSRI